MFCRIAALIFAVSLLVAAGPPAPGDAAPPSKPAITTQAPVNPGVPNRDGGIAEADADDGNGKANGHKKPKDDNGNGNSNGNGNGNGSGSGNNATGSDANANAATTNDDDATGDGSGNNSGNDKRNGNNKGNGNSNGNGNGNGSESGNANGKGNESGNGNGNGNGSADSDPNPPNPEHGGQIPPSKIAHDLQQADPKTTVRVIVQFRANTGQGVDEKVQGQGGRLNARLGMVGAAAYSVPAGALAEIASDPSVLYVTLDRPVRALMDTAGPAAGASFARQFGYDGRGIGIAVIDSGIADHPDLRDPMTGVSRVVYSEAFIGTGTGDQYGHGSHVVGILAGNAAASNNASALVTFYGVAPRAHLISL